MKLPRECFLPRLLSVDEKVLAELVCFRMQERCVLLKLRGGRLDAALAFTATPQWPNHQSVTFGAVRGSS